MSTSTRGLNAAAVLQTNDIIHPTLD